MPPFSLWARANAPAEFHFISVAADPEAFLIIISRHYAKSLFKVLMYPRREWAAKANKLSQYRLDYSF